MIKRGLLLAWVALVAVASGFSSGAETLEAILLDSKLPSGENPAVYDGQDSIYVVGGAGWRREIVKYSISIDRIQVIGQMVDARYGSAVWGGNGNIFYFGIINSNYENMDQVWGLNVDNPNNNVTLVSRMPEALLETAAVWDLQDSIYIVGGTGSVHSNAIFKYSIKSRAVELAGDLPASRSSATVVWDGRDPGQKVAYIFGGSDLDDILKFDPVHGGSTTKLNTSLPWGNSHACTVWTGAEAYIVGGHAASNSAQEVRPAIVRFNPLTEEVDQIQVKNFPDGLHSFGCIYAEKLRRIYVLGGYANGTFRQDIMYINLSPELPPAPVDCARHSDGTLLSNPYCCESFYECENKVAKFQTCPDLRHFNPWTWKCEEQAQVGCGLSYHKPSD